ncbi:hypothetical protein Hypma_014879 [Hypsizygus marmoreus]|uniref:C2H2-type domain-containing protein n=1 Tax=Hypsizygus marmoreus TaxID=39966 RepID=A0A369KC10_HYPMA|nr:hypothetical protein Hypma_014879 [Hypsizygus marmoreus]
MDPRLSHELVAEMLRFYSPPRELVRKRAVSPLYDRSKRYGTYFPSKASFNTKWNFADDESTWEFSAPVAPMERSSSTDTCSSGSSTPAQEIVLRYRAGKSFEAIIRGSSTGSETSVDSDASWETAPDDASMTSEQGPPVPEKDDIKAMHRQSRCDALMDTLAEAMAAMKKDGRGENERLVCHRPGCRDTVRDVKALMYHLHIHNIHDQSFTCPSCDKQFESGLHLNLHRCQGQETRLKSPPASPLKEGFLRVLGRISRHA